MNINTVDHENDGKKKRAIPSPIMDRGYVNLYEVQLDADMDFLQGKSGGEVPRDSHKYY
ncbi:hypothetical protein QSE00_19950 [Arenibacter sp. M-2]|uniref:hypothetical protein n=1 Tax=Arenibacter sp. M-2 TaxID=3053612 RepID=UPI002570FF2B|nr:hypothetical protein [Arenibacter sp. M-2]MDL5514098.1 hypothetical protein [Arenibacter sp. M-2]